MDPFVELTFGNNDCTVNIIIGPSAGEDQHITTQLRVYDDFSVQPMTRQDVAVNTAIMIRLAGTGLTSRLDYKWVVEGDPVDSYDTAVPRMPYTFTESGQFNVTAIVSNPAKSQSVWTIFTVTGAVQGKITGAVECPYLRRNRLHHPEGT